jgi:hypothetical protein
VNDLDALHDIRPDDERPTDEVTRAARTRLMALIEAATDREYLAADHGRISRNRRRTGAFAIAAAAVAAAVVVGTIAAGPRGAGGPQAAGALERIARVAVSHHADGTGSVVYTKSVGLYQDTTVANGVSSTTSDRDAREIWIAPDGSGRIRETRGATTSDDRFGPGGLSYTNFAGWPTDPTAMLAKLRAEAADAGPSGPPPDVEAFVVAGDALRETGAPPAVRAAILRAIVEIPGVTVLGTVRDQVGRSGLGVAISPTGADRQVIILDPTTSALLAEQTESPTTGAVDNWTAYLDSQFVAVVPPGGFPMPPSPDLRGRVRFANGGEPIAARAAS